MYYIGQYDLDIQGYVLDFPLEIDDGEYIYCKVENKEDHQQYLIIDYKKEVEELGLYNELMKGIIMVYKCQH